MATIEPAYIKPDHNSLGKAAFIIGLISLVMSFIPIIGFVSWLLAPLAILFGIIAVFRPSKSLAIAGIVTGLIALFICISWVKGASAVGEAMNRDTFNSTGEQADLSQAPILDATIKGVWSDMEDNKVAAGGKYGGHRLRFTDERIEDIGGDAKAPDLTFIGKEEEYINHMVGASFSEADGKKIAALKKGSKVTFVCQHVKETFGEGYSLGACILS